MLGNGFILYTTIRYFRSRFISKSKLMANEDLYVIFLNEWPKVI